MQTLPTEHPLTTLLALPAVDRTRRNHGLEHATLTMLARRNPQLRLVGRSTPAGFYLYGPVSLDAVQTAVSEALQHLQAGEADLAVHPNCGTNFVIAGFAAACAAYLGFVGANHWRERWGRLPLVTLLATLAIMAAQPVALVIQRDITTSGDVRGLTVTRIERHETGSFVTHFVGTEG
jgi:hypothetical protein